MADLRISSGTPHDTAAATAPHDADDGDSDDFESLDDVPPPRLSRGDTDSSQGGGGGPTPHPFLRTSSSTVDEKVDDWVRESRHRLVADASTDAAQDLSRALILYKPVQPSGDEGHEGGGDGEGGGGPTPSPRTGGDGGDEINSAAAGAGSPGNARERTLARNGQCAGSGTAEGSSGPAGGGGGGSAHVNGLHSPPASLFGPPRGLCTAVSGGDDAGGAVLHAGEARGGVTADEMELDGAREEGDGPGQWDQFPVPEQPELSRVGSTRGAPTPELTPEWVARVRASSRMKGQDPGEIGVGPGSKSSLPTERWVNW
ncbi:unnamed protein product [Laminaria digitata]